MTVTKCDHCGKDIVGSEWEWQIGIKLISCWGTDVRGIHLCGKCGWMAARLLGYQQDTGKILSIAKKETVVAATLHQSITNLAVNGFTGGADVLCGANSPESLDAGAMMTEAIE